MQENQAKTNEGGNPLVGFDLAEGKEHTHKGHACVPGAPVTMRKSQADNLVKLGVGKIASVPKDK